MRKTAMIAAMLVFFGVTTAGASDVATYLAKMDVVRSKGVTAMFSSDYHDLTAELRQAVAALKKERLAMVRSGRVPAYCPSVGASLSALEVMTALRAIPPEARSRTSVKDALRAGFARRYPCR